MAKDDMEVIMYKILRYLYECMKNDKTPELSEYGWESELFSISKDYWMQIIIEMVEKKYIKGFTILKTKTCTIVEVKEKPTLTMEGREFLLENSTMAKVRDNIGEAFNVILSGIFGKIIGL